MFWGKRPQGRLYSRKRSGKDFVGLPFNLLKIHFAFSSTVLDRLDRSLEILEISCLAFFETQNVLDFKLTTVVSALSIPISVTTLRADKEEENQNAINICGYEFVMFTQLIIYLHSSLTTTKNNGATMKKKKEERF